MKRMPKIHWHPFVLLNNEINLSYLLKGCYLTNASERINTLLHKFTLLISLLLLLKLQLAIRLRH